MDTLVTTLYSSPVRDALGQRTQYTHPNGMRTESDYDSWNLPCSFPNWIWERDCTQNCILRPSVKSGGDLIMTAEREIEFQEQVRYEMQFRNEPLPASTDAVLDSFEYTLNAGNEITRIDSADGSNWRYTYDDRGRLDYALWYDSSNAFTDYYDYTFDDGDNLTQYWRFNTVTSVLDTWDYAYNAANQQTSMTLNSGTAETRTYDDWGRLTARSQGSYSAAYSYRYGDRLRQVTSSFPGETATSPVYEYGGDGKMRRRGAEELKYGLGFNPINERTWLLAAKSFVYEPNKAVSERMAYFGIGFDGNQHYYNHDHLGSVRRTRSSAKGSLGVWNYEPFGKVHSGTATPLIFALHPYESGMGFHRAPYRNYSPAMARWTTVDPLGMVDGPNMYGYVGGNSVNNRDKDGLSIRMWFPQHDPLVSDPIIDWEEITQVFGELLYPACVAGCVSGAALAEGTVISTVAVIGILSALTGSVESDAAAWALYDEFAEQIGGMSRCVFQGALDCLSNCKDSLNTLRAR